MPPFALFSLGALTGAGLALLAPSLARSARPLAKEAIKLALLAAHEATVRAAQVAESVEDLYAEASAEAGADPVTAAAAAREAVDRARAAAAPQRRRASRRTNTRRQPPQSRDAG
jgi:hypothetical protein